MHFWQKPSAINRGAAGLAEEGKRSHTLVYGRQGPPAMAECDKPQVMALADDGRSGILVDTDIMVTFRSTEGLIQFIGRCLTEGEIDSLMLCKIGDEVSFALHKGVSPGAFVSTSLRGEHYY